MGLLLGLFGSLIRAWVPLMGLIIGVLLIVVGVFLLGFRTKINILFLSRASSLGSGIKNQNLASISLIAPTTSKDRITKICNSSSGFIYYVTLRGVTGSSDLNINEAESNINYIRSKTSLPVFAGFGIKTPEDAFNLSKISDGIVIGSSLVEMIHQQSSKKEFKKIYNYLHEISEAIK